MVLFFVLPAVLILVGAGTLIMRRRDATPRWVVGVLLWVVAAFLVLYVVMAILSRML